MHLRKYILSQLEDSHSKDSRESLVSILFEDIADLNALPKEDIDRIISRVLEGEPIQYITRLAPFYGYFFKVDNNVLIPRPETEELVFAVEKYMKKHGLESARIMDIGTGSGCIPITVNKLFPEAKVVGVDVSEKALLVAKTNNLKLEANVSFLQMDFLDERLWGDLGDFDIIISNPPYIPNNEKTLMSGNVLDYEPHLALFVENDDPLIFYKKVLQFALGQTNDIAIFLECNEFNASEVAILFESLFDTEIIKDLQGKDRIVKAMLWHN